jgi:multiple sugar transport system permease protein
MTVIEEVEHLVAPPGRPRRHQVRERRREALFGLGMIGLSMFFVAVFTAGPIVVSFILSFFSWDVISEPSFVALDNYARIFTEGTVLRSLGVTLLLGVSIVVLQIVFGLALAVLVNQRRRNGSRVFFRTAFYLPLLASTAAVSIFMGYMFDFKFGLINYYLSLLGIPNVPWLTSAAGAMVTIVLVAVWQQVGFTFVLFVAALMSVPTDVLEAAQVDGAGPLRMLFKIKIPLISPTILFAAVVAMINAMQLFDQPFIMTSGGPGDATTTMTIVMFRAAFQNLEFGFGSAIAIVLLLVILAITALQFLAARRLVFYQ